MPTELPDGVDRPDRTETDERLQAEREKTDEQLLERETSDAIVGEPRAVELVALLTHERDETDARLDAERTRSDDIIDAAARKATADEAVNTELEAFNYTLAHDLRNPISAIATFSAMLLEKRGALLNESARAYMVHIADSAREMELLVTALLDLAHLARVEIQGQPADLAALAQIAIARLRASEPHRSVEFIVQDGMIVHGDPALLRSVIENLLGNAWKYTRKATSARVELGCDDARGEPVYYVRDNGVGFDMAYATAMFTPFCRLHSRSEFEGTGIGLATTQRIISRLGGRIWAEGAIGEGATFRFTMPNEGAAPAAAD